MSGTAVTVSHPAGLPSTWRRPPSEERFEASKLTAQEKPARPRANGLRHLFPLRCRARSVGGVGAARGRGKCSRNRQPRRQPADGPAPRGRHRARLARTRRRNGFGRSDPGRARSYPEQREFRNARGQENRTRRQACALAGRKGRRRGNRLSLRPHVDGALQSAAQSQVQVFRARKAAYATRKELLAQRIEQLQIRIKGLEAQKDNVRSQVAIIKEEVEGKETLLQKGLLPKPEALKLKRAETELLGRLSEIDNEISKALQETEESRLQIVSADGARVEEIANDTDKTQSDIAEINERLRSSKDVLNRTTITAPVDGTVINMRLKTIGGVAQSGETLMEIVPRDDVLMIEAHVSPNDIHRVHMGQEAQIHFSAFSSRVMPRIEGIVRSTSADRVREADGQQSYFLARVEIDRQKLKERAGDVVLIPGMSAEVVFVAEKRTALEYLLKPLNDALRRGMLER